MRTLFTLTFVAIFIHSSAQVVRVFSDGQSEDITVKAVHSSGIYNGVSWITVFDSLQIVKPGAFDDAIYVLDQNRKNPPSPLLINNEAENYGEITINAFEVF